MSKTNAFENAFLQLIFNAVGIANIADDAASSPVTDLYVSLHTDTPGEDGDQTTNEATFTNYARIAVSRDASGWSVSGNVVSPVANIDFPVSGSDQSVTHVGIGTDSTGAGNLLFYGVLSPSMSVISGETPRLTTGTTITED